MTMNNHSLCSKSLIALTELYSYTVFVHINSNMMTVSKGWESEANFKEKINVKGL